VEVFRKERRSINGKEMSTSSNAVKVNDCKAATITLKFRLYNPHPSLIIWFISNWNKPMYECAWVNLIKK
jgi:hypothetical protein